MKNKVGNAVLLIAFVGALVGVSFVPLNELLRSTLFLFSFGIGLFASLGALALSLVIKPLFKPLNIIRLASMLGLVFLTPFVNGVWLSWPYWALLVPIFALGSLWHGRKLWLNIVLSIVLAGALAVGAFAHLTWLSFSIVGIAGFLAIVSTSDSRIRLNGSYVLSLGALIAITALPYVTGIPIGFVGALIMESVGLTVPLVRDLRKTRIENEAIRESELRVAHIEEKALKAEIRPHFLLNALNNVRVAYHENIDEGRKLLQELIALETLIAESSTHDMIPLSQEIKIIEGLVRLFCLERKQEIEFDVDVRNPDLLIPPMLLEPLVENSLQHSGIMSQEDGKVSIQEYEDYGFAFILVSDNGQGQPLPSQSRGIGLSNVIKRIDLLDNGHMNISSDENGTMIEIRFRLEQTV